jgi:hypothetical protein
VRRANVQDVGVGGGGSRAAIVQRLQEWNRENDEALEEDPERWPQQASNFNLLPVNVAEKHAGRDLGVDVPSSLRPDTEALISPLIGSVCVICSLSMGTRCYMGYQGDTDERLIHTLG